MAKRNLWAAMLAALVALSAFAGTVSAQTDDERPGPVPVDRDSTGTLAGALAAVAESSNARVTVRVDFDGPAADVRAAAAGVGGRVTDSYGQTLSVEIPARALKALSEIAGVRSVSPFLKPDPLAVTSQGVVSTGANAWHDLGLRGAGVKVAVIDFGFSGYQEAIALAELPPTVQTQSYCASLENGEPHGTAVAEILHDVAPDAQLYLICVETELDLENAVDFAIANGIDIINHSGGWFLGDRGDGSSTVASPSHAARRADEAGILWVAAGGNYATDHWMGAWNPMVANGITLQDFDTNSGESSTDFDLSVVVPAGESLQVYLKWDNWPTTNEDLDLYVWDGLNNLLRESKNDQDGQAQAPTEWIEPWFNNTGVAKRVYIEIRQFAVTNPGELDLLIFGHADDTAGGLEYSVPAGSIADPAFSPNVLAVGASCHANNQIEYFSSLGPTIDGRTKPDITTADAVATNTYGGTGGSACEGFLGTSAAAPHAAGLAALIMHAAPNWGKDRVVQALMDYSVDLGPVGVDNTFGHGDVVLGSVPTEECSPLTTLVTGIAGSGTVVDALDGSATEEGAYIVTNNDASLSICTNPGTPLASSVGNLAATAAAMPATESVTVGFQSASAVVRQLPCLPWVDRSIGVACWARGPFVN